VLGMDLLIRSNDIVGLYLALELQSLSFYVLSAYRRTSLYGTESGLKYYVLGSLSSCILLLGMAFVYGITGLTNLTELSLVATSSVAIRVSVQLMLVGFLFKLAAFPFHM